MAAPVNLLQLCLSHHVDRHNFVHKSQIVPQRTGWKQVMFNHNSGSMYCWQLNRYSVCSIAQWLGRGTPWTCLKLRRAEGREFEPRPGQYSRMSFSSDQVTGTVFSHLDMPFLLNLFTTLSSWGSDNYRPSAPLLYEVASHVKKTAIPAIIITRQVTRAMHVRNRICPRVKLIIKIIIILLIIFLGFIKSKSR